MQNIVIVGASGHGGMILDIIEKEGRYRMAGFVDSFKEKGSMHYGHKVLGDEGELPLLIDKFNLYGAILAIGNNWTRKNMARKVGTIAPNLKIVTAIHPEAIVAKAVKIGKGSVLMAGAIVNT
ncbi:MAG: transferase, partial [Pricia sp.]